MEYKSQRIRTHITIYKDDKVWLDRFMAKRQIKSQPKAFRIIKGLLQ